MKRSLIFSVWSAALLASVVLVGCKKNLPAPEAKEKEDAPRASKDHDDESEGHEELPTKVRLPAEVLASADVRTAVVTKKPLPATVDLTGEVVADPDRAVRVAARVPGRIVEVRFKEGERVKAGAILVVIESPELARARAGFAASQARGQSAQKNAERLGNLAKTGLAAGQEVAAAFRVPSQRVAVVHLDFVADVALADVEFEVTLPIELHFVDGGKALAERTLLWHGQLAMGRNPIPLAVSGAKPGRYRVTAQARGSGVQVRHDILLEVVPS